MTEVTVEKTPAEIKKEQAKANRIAAMARARAARKTKIVMTEISTETNIEPSKLFNPVIKSKEIVWFGEVDLNKKTGMPASDYPAWYHDIQIEDLKEEIKASEKALDLDLYKGKDLMRMREQLSIKKNRLNQIEGSKPVITDIDKDKIAKSRQSLGSKIGASMFTSSEMMKGTADAHVEAERMVKPCIKIDNEYEASLVKSCGMHIVDSKISRNNAERIWKIQGKILGEAILDTEQLRPAK